MTLYEKGHPDFVDIPFLLTDEGAMFGDPKLVYLDLEEEKIVIDAEDPSLIYKTFQVVINCHIQVNSTI